MAPISSQLIAAVCLAAALFAPMATALAAPPSTVRLQVNGQALPFVAVVVACLMVITYFPPLSLTLRDLVYR